MTFTTEDAARAHARLLRRQGRQYEVVRKGRGWKVIRRRRGRMTDTRSLAYTHAI